MSASRNDSAWPGGFAVVWTVVLRSVDRIGRDDTPSTYAVGVFAAKGGERVTKIDDVRFDVPLYTIAEAARYVRVPASTYATWARGYDREMPDRRGGRRRVHGDPVVTALETAVRGRPVVPFVGLAESMVLAAFRTAGVSLQHIRQALPVLQRQVGVEHALASERLYTDGAVILYDFANAGVVDAEMAEELTGLTRVVDGQRVFAEIVRDYLRRITYGDDGWAAELVLPYGDRDILRVTPDRASGQPLFVRGGAPLGDVVSRWRAGERLADLATDFEIPAEDIEDALRIAVGVAA